MTNESVTLCHGARHSRSAPTVDASDQAWNYSEGSDLTCAMRRCFKASPQASLSLADGIAELAVMNATSPLSLLSGVYSK